MTNHGTPDGEPREDNKFLLHDRFFNRKCKMKLQKKSKKVRFDNEKGWKVKKEECKILIQKVLTVHLQA